MFYTYYNHGPRNVEVELERGIGEWVIIEAENPEDANMRAEKIGLYFDGVEKGIDCSCCGDRFDRAKDGCGNVEESQFPAIYGIPVENYKFKLDCYRNRNPQRAFVHYIDGTIKWYGSRSYAMLNRPKKKGDKEL